MVKHTQTIRRRIVWVSVFDHFVILALKGLKSIVKRFSQYIIFVQVLPILNRFALTPLPH